MVHKLVDHKVVYRVKKTEKIRKKGFGFQNLCIFAADCSGKKSGQLKAICACIRLMKSGKFWKWMQDTSEPA